MRVIFSPKIWANVQANDEPFRLSYDLTKPKLWQPFFSKSYPRPALSSVQVTMVMIIILRDSHRNQYRLRYCSVRGDSRGGGEGRGSEKAGRGTGLREGRGGERKVL